MLLIGTVIIAFSGIFINEMAATYSVPNMSSEFGSNAINNTAWDHFKNTSETAEDMAKKTQSGLSGFVAGTLDTIADILFGIFTAPITFAEMIENVLDELNVNENLTSVIGYLIKGVLYVLILFVLVSSFLRGGRL
jgi:hypothetical protein